MTQHWNEYGQAFPVTVLWLDDNTITQVKRRDPDGVTALQVGAGIRKPKQLNRSLQGHYRAAGVPLKHHLAEFPVTEDALLPVGTPIHATHFVPGQYVDCLAMTKFKGFQGVMKKWGFAGQPASHGVSLTHRSRGSSGPRTGRLWKGTKMAGWMGGENTIVQSMYVWRVDGPRNLLHVRGSVPGPVGGWVRVRDASRRSRHFAKYPAMAKRPLPTFLGEVPADGVMTAPWDRPDPNRLGQDLDSGEKNPLKASKAAAGATTKKK